MNPREKQLLLASFWSQEYHATSLKPATRHGQKPTNTGIRLRKKPEHAVKPMNTASTPNQHEDDEK
jgi:hypothetical protein